MRLARHFRFLLIISIALTVALAACADREDNDAPDAAEIIDNAAETFDQTESAHFALNIDGSIGIDEEGMLELGAVEGEIERPSNARADASVTFAGSSVSMEMIASEGEMFLRNILTGDWERAPSDLQYDPARIFDEEQGIASIIEQLEDIELEGEDTVDGNDAWHVTGTVDTAAVRALAGDFFEGDQLDVDIWVATDDYRLLQVELHDTDAEEAMSWELTLSEHDEPVDITPPDLD